jgi:tRNA nucleotidyltransferase (CCA-adding enzyme)
MFAKPDIAACGREMRTLTASAITTAHRNCDFDGLASMVAAAILQPGAVPVAPRSINPNVRHFLAMHKDLLRVTDLEEIVWEAVRHLTVVDANRWERLDPDIPKRLPAQTTIALWDHHGGVGDIQAQPARCEAVGATITLLAQEMQRHNTLFTPIHATLFLIGLYEDTGSLTYNSTTAADARAAAYFLEHKADLEIARRFLTPAYGQRQREILFEIANAARRIKVQGLSVALGRIEVCGHLDSLALVVRSFREIMNADAAFGIFHQVDRGCCMVIARSTAEAIDVGRIMKQLGGGGHPGAGSALLKGAAPEAVDEMLTELVSGNQRASVRVSDLMSYPVTSVPSDMPMADVARVLRRKGCTGLPVVDDGRLRGVISRRDFRKVRQTSQMKAPVRAFMKQPVHTIDPAQSPSQAASLMIRYDIGRLPVVQDDRVIGIVTRSDVMLYYYDLLPD